MCLNTDQTKPLKATKNITVYKTMTTYWKVWTKLKIKMAGNNIYEERLIGLKSVRGHHYEIGKTYKVRMNYNSYVVEAGFHSYNLSLSTVKRRYQTFNTVVVECVIPKGSLYYVGLNNGDSKGIASNQIRVVKIV